MLRMWYPRENAYWDVGDVEICGCFRFGMFQIWNVQDLGCLDVRLSGCGMFGMWHVQDVGCSRCGMFGMWNVRDVGCWACRMFGMSNVQDVGC